MVNATAGTAAFTKPPRKKKWVAKVKSSDLIALLKEVEPHRNEVVQLRGEFLPKSAAMLMSVLGDEIDSTARFELYTNAILECRAACRTSAAVMLAQAQYQEFSDVASLMAYSDALGGNGESEAGVSRAKEALDLAIQKQTLVNYAAGNLVRQAIKTGSVRAVNEALVALIESTQVPRKGDCALESDWVNAAESLGADMELMSWVQSATAQK